VMGNSSNKSKLDPDLLKTRGLYPQRDWDERSLKKMVQKGKIAPFYQGMTEAQSGSALEECPICMLWYDALNRSNCCQKPICSGLTLYLKSDLTSCFRMLPTSASEDSRTHRALSILQDTRVPDYIPRTPDRRRKIHHRAGGPKGIRGQH